MTLHEFAEQERKSHGHNVPRDFDKRNLARACGFDIPWLAGDWRGNGSKIANVVDDYGRWVGATVMKD